MLIVCTIVSLGIANSVLGANYQNVWDESVAFRGFFSLNSTGIILGLLIGKPIGICPLPLDLNWQHIFGAGLLGGIGFTMSIFITNLAFAGNTEVINASKMAILLAFLAAGTSGFLWLKFFGKPDESDDDMDAMDFDVAEV